MRGRRLALFLVLGAGCQSGTGDPPPLPVSPPPPAPEPPPEEIRLVPTGFGGPLFQPNSTLPVTPGTVLKLPVMTVFNDFTRDGQRPGLSIFVRTDAPPAVLSASPQVWVGGRGDPGLVEVRVSPGAPSGERSAAFRVWLEEDPNEQWAPGWGLGLDATPLRVRVVEPMAQPAPCEQLELTGRVAPGIRDGGDRAQLTFGSLAAEFHSSTITLRADHPETSLTLLSQYRMPYEDLDPESDRARVRFNPYPTAFALGLGFRESGAGFEQTMSLGWFDELHLRAEAPGCDPVNLSCDETGRCSPESPTP